jgi:hypothetical protein
MHLVRVLLRGVYLLRCISHRRIYLTGVHVIGVYLTGVHLVGVYLILIGVHL